jgi:pilus assembly protein Flp/PilA
MLYLTNEDGQGLVEYALILVLVSIVVIVVLSVLGPQIGNVFSQITTALAKPPVAGVPQ